MATITKSALQWVQEELENKDEIISELEEELGEALEENAALRALIQRMKATLQVE